VPAARKKKLGGKVLFQNHPAKTTIFSIPPGERQGENQNGGGGGHGRVFQKTNDLAPDPNQQTPPQGGILARKKNQKKGGGAQQKKRGGGKVWLFSGPRAFGGGCISRTLIRERILWFFSLGGGGAGARPAVFCFFLCFRRAPQGPFLL